MQLQEEGASSDKFGLHCKVDECPRVIQIVYRDYMQSILKLFIAVCDHLSH